MMQTTFEGGKTLVAGMRGSEHVRVIEAITHAARGFSVRRVARGIESGFANGSSGSWAGENASPQPPMVGIGGSTVTSLNGDRWAGLVAGARSEKSNAGWESLHRLRWNAKPMSRRTRMTTAETGAAMAVTVTDLQEEKEGAERTPSTLVREEAEVVEREVEVETVILPISTGKEVESRSGETLEPDRDGSGFGLPFLCGVPEGIRACTAPAGWSVMTMLSVVLVFKTEELVTEVVDSTEVVTEVVLLPGGVDTTINGAEVGVCPGGHVKVELRGEVKVGLGPGLGLAVVIVFEFEESIGMTSILREKRTCGSRQRKKTKRSRRSRRGWHLRQSRLVRVELTFSGPQADAREWCGGWKRYVSGEALAGE
ncbi:hypothetical protein EDB92DRAFT_1815739 [Lactarius akahatsu]|uniref:Uncharacterized protein n=1 Tax=Lactarius akahatsu TaxID=416441 RepID=A0AAD4LI47_9AGAM|nr:hypothetical protein EDB92DRAFT_1815739 [Lactarius akahatsu]